MIKVDLKTGVFVQTHPKGKVKALFDKVLLQFGSNRVEFTTPAAHKLGFALIRKELEAREIKGAYIALTINGVDVSLLPREAKRIGAGLLIKADDADDFQRSLRA